MKSLFVFLIALIATSSTHASEIALYRDGQPVASYNSDINRVQPGDTLTLDNVRFTVTKDLGRGLTTHIFAIDSERALRLPIAQGEFNGLYDYRNYITAYAKGSRLLLAAGIHAVRVYEAESRPPNFLVVDRVETQFDLREYLAQRAANPDAERIDAELFKFARSTARFALIGDFHSGQLRWTGSEWILMDFTSSSSSAANVGSHTAFDPLPLPYALKKELVAAIREQRREWGFSEGRSAVVSAPQCQRLMR